MWNAHAARPAKLAGRAFLALLVALPCFAVGQSLGEILQHADQIKTSNNAEFQNILTRLDADSTQLTDTQRAYLAYLKAWQLSFHGNFEQGVSALNDVLAHTSDPTLQARARITLLNEQANAAHYDAAFSNLSLLLDSLPKIDDKTAHFRSLAVAALLYNQAGQYGLALKYIGQLLVYDPSARSTCIATALRSETLFRSGKLQGNDAQIQAGLDQCKQKDSDLFANTTRIWLAKAYLHEHNAKAALRLLANHENDVMQTRSSSVISLFQSTLAQCYLELGDLTHAHDFAQGAIDHANKQVFAKSVAEAYQVLYQTAKKQGDDHAALAYHEKYADADKGYMNDVSARALAFQKVHQQVLDKQRQLDAANDSNKLLSLKQQVDAQKARTRLLYIALLFSGLVIVIGWAYRTKRSQVKFQKLARRDGLTGICNRQHFFESAHAALRYCAKGAREASVLVLDLDHFKSVNDMHGHAAGDEALRRVVAACQARLRSIDIFGRLGGEEFAILLPDCSENAASQRAEEMRADIADLPRFDAYADVLVTASFGVASSRACGYNLTTLLANADSALYAAKHAGRNCVVKHQAKAQLAQA